MQTSRTSNSKEPQQKLTLGRPVLVLPVSLSGKRGAASTIFMPRHQKVAGYYVIPSEILSVRPSVRLSVRPSVRPSAPTTILVSATPPTVLGQSF